MSIAAMVDNEVARSQGEPPPTATRRRAGRRRGAGAGEKQRGPGEAISALVSYVPAEAIAAYLLLLPFMDPSDETYTGRWALAGGVALLSIFYAVGYRKIAAVRDGTEFKAPLLPAAISVLAFAAWVFAIPDSPFNDCAFYTPELGAAAGTVAASMLSFIGAVTGEVLTYAAVETEEAADPPV